MQTGRMYKFRVRAVNRQGESEPLESERAIVAKNPFGKLKDTFWLFKDVKMFTFL